MPRNIVPPNASLSDTPRNSVFAYSPLFYEKIRIYHDKSKSGKTFNIWGERKNDKSNRQRPRSKRGVKIGKGKKYTNKNK